MPSSTLQAQIAAFLNGFPFAVVGASPDREKYGNKVLRCYVQNGRAAIPINPHAAAVEGLKAYPTLHSVPGPIHAASIITPPPITERIVEDAHAAGIHHLWMQPGAESPAAVARAKALGMNVISGCACVLVVLGYSEH